MGKDTFYIFSVGRNWLLFFWVSRVFLIFNSEKSKELYSNLSLFKNHCRHTNFHLLFIYRCYSTTNKSPYLKFHVWWYILIRFIIEHQSYKNGFFFPYHRLHFQYDKRELEILAFGISVIIYGTEPAYKMKYDKYELLPINNEPMFFMINSTS